ncbi:MAG TPA: hypothetical protein VEJ45_07115 [Candidatus Acidoferrales bacterium]|nr:hypothetical protein [Candidatus Acidoferrales bacterium]
MNDRCRATPNLSADQLWEYQDSLIALMAALGLGRSYEKELNDARKISRRLAYPFSIDVVEIPSA